LIIQPFELSGNGDHLYVTGGNSDTALGGFASFSGGNGGGAGNGGAVYVTGGNSGATGAGGTTYIQGGVGGATSGHGGTVNIYGGNATNGSAGSVIIAPGSVGGFNVGSIAFYPYNGYAYGVYFDLSLMASSNKTFTFPNVTGNLAVATSGAGVPTGTAPVAIGQIYVDTSASKVYISKGTSAGSDWLILN
jgi:hypothetical protein